MKRSRLWYLCAAACVVIGLGLMFTPVSFTGGLLAAAGAVLALFCVLGNRKTARRILLLLIVCGFAVFAVAEVQVLRYAFGKDDRPAAAVIVLGAGVYGTQPSLSLRVRLEAALDYADAHPDIPIVVSGGQGSGESISEAQCMRDWLVSHGLEASRIRMEDQSTSTRENLEYSAALLRAEGIDTTANIAVVSADYHLYRARLYWGLPWMVPVPASMPRAYWPLTVNYFIREAFGVVYFRVFE